MQMEVPVVHANAVGPFVVATDAQLTEAFLVFAQRVGGPGFNWPAIGNFARVVEPTRPRKQRRIDTDIFPLHQLSKLSCARQSRPVRPKQTGAEVVHKPVLHPGAHVQSEFAAGRIDIAALARQTLVVRLGLRGVLGEALMKDGITRIVCGEL